MGQIKPDLRYTKNLFAIVQSYITVSRLWSALVLAFRISVNLKLNVCLRKICFESYTSHQKLELVLHQCLKLNCLVYSVVDLFGPGPVEQYGPRLQSCCYIL